MKIDTKPKRRKKSKHYFTKDTELAVLQYIDEKDRSIKEHIYVTKLKYPFEKMAESIINRFKFPYIHEKIDDLIVEAVSHIMLNIDRFDPDKGKAFSYFSITMRNYFFGHNKENYALSKVCHSIDNETSLEIIDEEYQDRIENDTIQFVSLMLEYWENNKNDIFKTSNDIKIADAIFDLFRMADDLEHFKRKYLYVIIRERTNIKTQYITPVLNKINEHNRRLLKEFNEHGIFDTNMSSVFFQFYPTGTLN